MGAENPKTPEFQPNDDESPEEVQSEKELKETDEQRRVRLANEAWRREQQSRWRFNR